MQVLGFWLAAMLAAANPFSLTPTPSPAPSFLPEIGRVRSSTPACAVMRDIVAPSFAAAMRADARFAATQTQLPRFAELRNDTYNRNGGIYAMTLSKIDRDATAMRTEALALERALRDPRLAVTTDPNVATERSQLQQLYDIQSGRANLLFEFAQRERFALMRAGLAPSSQGFGGPAPAETNPPAPELTSAPLGMPPPPRGIDLIDERMLTGWGNDIAAAVRLSEHRFAVALLPISQGCR